MVVFMGHRQWAFFHVRTTSIPTHVFGNEKSTKATGAGQVHLLMFAEASQTDFKCKLNAPKSMLHFVH